jgi:hypothetical protein
VCVHIQDNQDTITLTMHILFTNQRYNDLEKQFRLKYCFNNKRNMKDKKLEVLFVVEDIEVKLFSILIVLLDSCIILSRDH